MIWSVVVLPFLLGAISFFITNKSFLRRLLPVGGVLQGILVLSFWIIQPEGNTLVFVDALGFLFLSVTSFLFLIVSFYASGFLQSFTEKLSIFAGCLFFFLASMSLVCISADMGLLWVAIEATTLSSAPLIYFHKDHRSLEATWKYLLICSVGIALAWMGNIFLSYAGKDVLSTLFLPDIEAKAPLLDPHWLKVAFILWIVGYGTKMGLAPLHSWLPDAHSEAPSAVSALLSGALLNCAFLGILRGFGILKEAQLENWGRGILVFFGLASILLAGIFLLRQNDFKRMLAYSSVEHMGILVLGTGMGGIAAIGALFHMVNHSLTKGLLFLTAGNILHHYRTKNLDSLGGILKQTPRTGFLWILGFLAITGFPPFGLFLSEWFILRGILEEGLPGIGILYLSGLFLVFLPIARYVIQMVWGDSQVSLEELPKNESYWSWLPPLVLGSIVLVLGVYPPPSFIHFLELASNGFGGW
ncbi:MAG: proton-conducting transporter membrane subunit [Spirochaetales bacterium]